MVGALSQAEFDALLRVHARQSHLGPEAARTPLDLTGHSLRHLDLRGRDLDGIVLVDTDLSGCDLTGADLDRALLMGANLRGTRLVDATLYSTNLGGADLTDADLTGARLLRTDLTYASLVGAVLDRTDLTRAYFYGADLRKAVVRHARLDRTTFDEAWVTDADFTGTVGTVDADASVLLDDPYAPHVARTVLLRAGAQVEAYDEPREP